MTRSSMFLAAAMAMALGACGGGGDDGGGTGDGIPGFDREIACYKMGNGGGNAGDESTCIAAKNVNDDAYDQEMMTCPISGNGGGVFSDTCPTANLFGCCHHPTTAGGYEQIECYYNDDVNKADRKATCEGTGGMTFWNTTP